MGHALLRRGLGAFCATLIMLSAAQNAHAVAQNAFHARAVAHAGFEHDRLDHDAPDEGYSAHHHDHHDSGEADSEVDAPDSAPGADSGSPRMPISSAPVGHHHHSDHHVDLADLVRSGADAARAWIVNIASRFGQTLLGKPISGIERPPKL